MLDLKAKLAAAGLVTQEQIAAAERQKAAKKQPRAEGKPPGKPAEARPPARPRSGFDVPALKKAGKAEIYEAVRRAVERSRLDPVGALPGERAEAFHFTTQTGQLGRLTLEPEIREQVIGGEAGIIAYMSHHGLAHCVVPRVVAEDLAEFMPLWLRVLKDHPAAGQLAPPPAPSGSSKKSEPTD